MPTIVEYSDIRPPKNLYPKRIISPNRSGPCCFSDMEILGNPEVEGLWIYAYRRCRRCGFTVRVVLRRKPDRAAIHAVQALFRTTLSRFDWSGTR